MGYQFNHATEFKRVTSMGVRRYAFVGPYIVVPAARGRVRPIADIQKLVSWYYDLEPKDILGPNRCRRFAHPRQVAMYLARHHTRASIPMIGQRFGGRDHTTVIHACKAVSLRRRTNPEVDDQVRELEAML